MYDLTRFNLTDMTRCGAELRRLATGAASMEEVANRVVAYLYRELRMPPEQHQACVLVRTFVTLPFDRLDPALQRFARHVLADVDRQPTTKCLTLLATAGDEPAWNSRLTSAGHQALPLASPQSVSRSPMISQLIRQLGVELDVLLGRSSDVMIDVAQHTFNVFHVPDAVGSPYIPAQNEFVRPYGVRSVVGFGGLLGPGELFATIMFTRAPVSREVAELFKTLALNVKVGLLPFYGSKVFS